MIVNSRTAFVLRADIRVVTSRCHLVDARHSTDIHTPFFPRSLAFFCSHPCPRGTGVRTLPRPRVGSTCFFYNIHQLGYLGCVSGWECVARSAHCRMLAVNRMWQITERACIVIPIPIFTVVLFHRYSIDIVSIPAILYFFFLTFFVCLYLRFGSRSK